MKVRNRVESEASKDAEMGMKAGILGPDPGFNPGKGSMNITESVTSPFFGNDVAPKQTWVENSNESSNNERRMCLKKNLLQISGIELSYYCYFTGKSVIKNEIINAFVGLYKGVFIIISRFCRENPNLCLLIY